MAASDALSRRVLDAGRSCSLTTAVLEEWSRLGTPKQVEYLAGYLEAERASREASKRAELLRRCALPAPKAFDGYDWSAVAWPEGLGREGLLSLSFPGRREDLVLMGDVGTGKTHMASALCAPACERRLEARFFTASSLVARLRRARDEGRLDRESARPGRARLLVVDCEPTNYANARRPFAPTSSEVEREGVPAGADTPSRYLRASSSWASRTISAVTLGALLCAPMRMAHVSSDPIALADPLDSAWAAATAASSSMEGDPPAALSMCAAQGSASSAPTPCIS